jgi:hypothetical protein
MRSTIAFALFWLNLIVTSLVIYFAITSKNRYSYDNYNGRYSYHLRGTKQKLLESNPNYFLESTIETPKELRQLSTDMQYYIIYVDIVALFFVFIIMASFCITENECCTNDDNIRSNFAIGSCYGTCVCCNDCGRHGNTNCDCKGDGAAGLLILLIIIIAIVAIYFAVKACGKHISRVISVVMLILLELAMAGMSFYTGSDTYLVLLSVFCIIAAICNFLGLLLPNLGSCNKLSYSYNYAVNPVPTVPVSQPFIQPTGPPVIQVPPSQPMAPVYDYPSPNEIQTNQQMAPVYNTQGQGYDAPPIVYPQNY